MAKKFYEFQPNDEVAESGDLSNLTPASVDLVSWQDLTIQDGEESIEDKIANDDAHIKTDGVASAFTEKTYAAGDFCTYDGKAYMCKLGYTSTAASPDPGNDATHWQLANLPILFSSDNTSLAREVRYKMGDAITEDATLVDRTTNLVQVTTADIDLTLPAARTDGRLRDLLIRIEMGASATGTPSLVSFSSWEGDDMPTFAAGTNYLLTLTETKANTWFFKAIELEAKSAS